MLSLKHLEASNGVKKSSILSVASAQNPPLKYVSFRKFLSQEPHTLPENKLFQSHKSKILSCFNVNIFRGKSFGVCF